MKTGFLLISLLISSLTIAQEQKIVMQNGDTLLVNDMRYNADKIDFKQDGGDKYVYQKDVERYYANGRWVEMNPTELPIVSNTDTYLSKPINQKRNYHLNKAGTSLIAGTSASVLLAGLGILSNSFDGGGDLGLYFGIGSVLSLLIGNIVAGNHLIKASRY